MSKKDPRQPERPPEPETVYLVHQAQQGEEGALSALFARYYPRVRKVVRRRLGSGLRQHLDSSDILQDTFRQAAESFQSFQMHDDASLIKWLSKIAHRAIFEAVDYYGAAKRGSHKQVPIDPGEGRGAPEVPASDPTPSQLLSVQEEEHLLSRCLDELPEHQREVIVLRDFCQLGYQEIADATDRPTAAAARMMHATAIAKLGALMRRRRV